MILKFFDVCQAIVFTATFPTAPSEGYARKHWNNARKAISVCERVAREAQRQHVDPLLAISVAARETRFKDVISSKGARGPLGVIPKYHCPKKGKCDYTKAGISALKKYLDLNGGEVCAALAQYNRGNSGVCEPGRSEFEYAQDVISNYERVCSIAPYLCTNC